MKDGVRSALILIFLCLGMVCVSAAFVLGILGYAFGLFFAPLGVGSITVVVLLARTALDRVRGIPENKTRRKEMILIVSVLALISVALLLIAIYENLVVVK